MGGISIEIFSVLSDWDPFSCVFTSKKHKREDDGDR